MELLALMGTTLLYEENCFVGFLPLRSYLERQKQVGTGKRCPPDKEPLVRSLLIRESLEKLKCTSNENEESKEKQGKEDEVNQEVTVDKKTQKKKADDFFA